MAISRQHNTAVKLVALTGKATITAANVQFAVENWENEAFPRKLEMLVRRWMKANCASSKCSAELQAEYASLDEQSAKWLIDPCIEAQDAILKLKDEDDLVLLIKRAAKFTEISLKLWKAIADNDILTDRALTRLAAREDAPARFVKLFGAPVKAVKAAPAKTRRTRIEKEEVPTRGRTGKAQRVVKPKVQAVDSDLDLDDDEDDDRPVRKAKVAAKAKTVNKASKTEGAIAKIRKVVGPAKKLVRNNVHMEDQMNVKKVRGAVRTVRRPRV